MEVGLIKLRMMVLLCYKEMHTSCHEVMRHVSFPVEHPMMLMVANIIDRVVVPKCISAVQKRRPP